MDQKESKVVYRLDSMDLDGSIEDSIELLRQIKGVFEEKGYKSLKLFYNPNLNSLDVFGIFEEQVSKKRVPNPIPEWVQNQFDEAREQVSKWPKEKQEWDAVNVEENF